MHYQQVITGLLAGGIISLSACTGTSEPATAQDDPMQTEIVSTLQTERTIDIATIKNQYALQAGLFDKVTAGISDEEAARPINEHTNKISQGLDQLTAKQLQADSPFPIPFPEQSIRGLWGFQMHHLGYEIGQMALYRRFLGKEAMSYQ